MSSDLGYLAGSLVGLQEVLRQTRHRYPQPRMADTRFVRRGELRGAPPSRLVRALVRFDHSLAAAFGPSWTFPASGSRAKPKRASSSDVPGTAGVPSISSRVPSKRF